MPDEPNKPDQPAPVDYALSLNDKTVEFCRSPQRCPLVVAWGRADPRLSQDACSKACSIAYS